MLRQHKYAIVKESKPSNLICCMCNEPSTRRCLGIRIDEDIHKRLSKMIKRKYSEKEEFIDIEVFQKVVIHDLRIPMSKQRIITIFEDCSKKNGERLNASETLKMFRLLLHNIGKDCDGNFCAECWEQSHSKGTRSRHEWIGYKANAPVCIECRNCPANSFCLTCQDMYCSSCSKELHSFGKMREHKFNKILEPKESTEEEYCATCGIRIAISNCELCQANTCDSCKVFSHKRSCKMWRKVRALGHEQITCSICNNIADSKCRECGELYCSVKSTDHPGCFALMHQKGNRIYHTKYPYGDLIQYLDEVEQKKKDAESRRRKKLKRIEIKAKEEITKLELLKRKADQRELRLKNEARAEFHQMQEAICESKKRHHKRKRIFFSDENVDFLNQLRNSFPFMITKKP